MKSILVFLTIIFISNCYLGFDLSVLPSVESLKCLRQTQNKTFIIARAWRSFSAFDNNALQTIKNSLEAGFTKDQIGVYMFPCFSDVHTPQSQINDMIKGLGDAEYSQVWIDFETNPSPGCGWSTNFQLNCQFTQKLVNAAKKAASNKIVGIYASNYMWKTIMGASDKCPIFTDVPLWYAHYDGLPTLTDFTSFGGWKTPYIKQYKGTVHVCDIPGIDLNYKQKLTPVNNNNLIRE